MNHGDRLIMREINSSEPRFFPKNSALFCAGERPEYLYLLRSGWVKRERPLTSDRRVILAVYTPGDVVGIQGLWAPTYVDSVLALTNATYLTISLKRLRQLMAEYPSVVSFVINVLVHENARSELLAAEAVLSAQARVAAFLLRIYEKLKLAGSGSNYTFYLPLAQRDIGQHLGLTSVHVNRTLRELRRLGAVNVQRDFVAILNHDNLDSIARDLASADLMAAKNNYRAYG